ncbi:MAG: DUF192 domain-containing protein [Sphingomonadaceae bacterium]|nr:DUF192 domain-containing protein [Sphingomonadaceae bacterium]
MVVAMGWATISVADEPLVANPPLPTISLTLTSKGKPHRYTVEVAKTTVEQARGLMLRKVMGRGHGMLFPVAAPPHDVSFWMEGTYLPLDIIFIAPDHRVRRIAANAVPFSKADIPAGGPTAAVLELNAGEAARIGLQPGDLVDYTAD